MEIPEGILTNVLRLREQDVPGATLFSDGIRDEVTSLQYFEDNRFMMEKMNQWLSTRHISKTKLGARGKPEDMTRIELERTVRSQLQRETRQGGRVSQVHT